MGRGQRMRRHLAALSARTLNGRLTLAALALVALTSVGVTATFQSVQEQALRGELEPQARLLLDSLSALSADALYFVDAVMLDDMLDGLGEGHIVTSGLFYDARGRPLAS